MRAPDRSFESSPPPRRRARADDVPADMSTLALHLAAPSHLAASSRRLPSTSGPSLRRSSPVDAPSPLRRSAQRKSRRPRRGVRAGAADEDFERPRGKSGRGVNQRNPEDAEISKNAVNQLSAEQATALFQLSGWCLLQRGEALKEALLESYSERIERAFEFGE